MKVVYEINAEVEPALASAFESYMSGRHIPDLLATGCFLSAELLRTGDNFQMRYTAAGRADLDRYLADHADRLRADNLDHFPSGVRISRTVWDVVDEFPLA